MGTIIMWHKRERKLMKQATKSIKNFSLFTKNCNWEMKEAAKIKSTDNGFLSTTVSQNQKYGTKSFIPNLDLYDKLEITSFSVI